MGLIVSWNGSVLTDVVINLFKVIEANLVFRCSEPKFLCFFGDIDIDLLVLLLLLRLSLASNYSIVNISLL